MSLLINLQKMMGRILAAMILLSACSAAGPGATISATSGLERGGSAPVVPGDQQASNQGAPQTPNVEVAGNAADSGSKGGFFGSGSDPSDLGECVLNPNSKECIISNSVPQSGAPELHCVGDLTAVRLVYWRDWATEPWPGVALAWNPANDYQSVLKQGCMDAETVARAQYRDYCIKLDEKGRAPAFQDWPKLGFDPKPAYYFVKPQKLPTTLTPQRFESLAAYEEMMDAVAEERVDDFDYRIFMYLTPEDSKHALSLPGKKPPLSQFIGKFQCWQRPEVKLEAIEGTWKANRYVVVDPVTGKAEDLTHEGLRFEVIIEKPSTISTFLKDKDGKIVIENQMNLLINERNQIEFGKSLFHVGFQLSDDYMTWYQGDEYPKSLVIRLKRS